MPDPADTSPRPSRKERESDRHRREILDVAEVLFAEHGYFQTTMQTIADRAEFSVGYLYKHFPGKEEMYRELLGYHMVRLDEIVVQTEAENLSPLTEIHRSYELVCRHFNAHRDFMRIYHEEIGARDGELTAMKLRHFDVLVNKLGAAQAAGEIRADVDVPLLAAALEGATKELFRVLAERPTEPAFDDLPDLLFEFLINPARN